MVIARYKRRVAAAVEAMNAANRSKERRVIYNAECVRLADHPMRANRRFVVTNLTCDAETVYDIYRQRGASENLQEVWSMNNPG